MAHYKLGEILLKQGLITETQLNQAIETQKGEKGRIGEILVKLGVVREEDIAAALGTQLGIPYYAANSELLTPKVDQALEKLVPFEFAKKNCVLPLSKNMRLLTCTVADPLDLIMLDNLKKITGLELNLVIATRTALLNAINQFYLKAKGKTGDTRATMLNQAVQNTYSPQTSQDAIAQIDSSSATAELSIDKLIAKAGEAPVIKLVDLILRQAIDERASDIHVEPYKDKIVLRYRIDGKLYQIPPPASHLQTAIVSRIKILAKLDIAEKSLPQDGAISAKLEDRTVVLSILDKGAIPLELAGLGFDQTQVEKIRKAIKLPYGLLFVTGPTGSGKSTTLYASLHETLDPHKNIVTAEDPVEFKIEGINQVAIKSEIGLTFASALRAFLRQDPDVIMVGEVRDLETAS